MKQTATLIICIGLIIGISVWAEPKLQNLTDPMFIYPESYAQDGVNPFVGKWVNMDSNTSLNTKLAIGIEYNKMMVALWGACSPEDCFWGWTTADVPWCETQRIRVTWILTYANEFNEIIYMPDGDYIVMRSKTFGTYDNSGMCYSNTQYFVRGDFDLVL